MLKAKVKIINNLLSVILMISLAASSMVACGGKKKDNVEQGPQGERGEQGAPGKDGSDGETPFIGDNGNWWIGDIDTGVCATASDGRDGINGVNGRDGKDGQDGAPGKDGVTPIFSFDEATNMLSISYDGGLTYSLIIDLRAMCQSGIDGKDGVDGKDGKDGEDGKDGVDGVNGITPILSINEITNYWMVSYDNGATWTSLNVLATGEKGEAGKDGANGKDGKNGTDGANGTNGVDGKDGKDGLTPMVQINPSTFNWEVSYDNGENWIDLGIYAIGKNGSTGADGANGKDGKDGEDGETPEIYVENGQLYVKYPSRESTLVYDFSTVTGAKDGVTPELRINTVTYMWEVSYDCGVSWENLGVSAIGRNGVDGEDGKDGKDGKDGAQGEAGADGLTPRLFVEGDVLYVYYDNISNKVPVYDFSGLSGGSEGAAGANGKDGITPQLKIDGGYWYVSYDNGKTWASLGVKASGDNGKNGVDGANGKDGKDGEDGKNGADGRGIAKVWMSNGSLMVTYTDGTVETVGEIGAIDSDSSGSGSSGSVVGGSYDVYTDALDFYPLNNGNEYGVAIGRARYMEKIVIPSYYMGKPVTTILNDGFGLGAACLTEIVIPDTVTTIEDGAFNGCANIQKISLPDSVRNIGKFAFCGVQCVELYAFVENVSSGAFVDVNTVIVNGADGLPDGWPEFDEGVVVRYING